MTLLKLFVLFCQQGNLLVDVQILAVDSFELLCVLVGQDLVFLHEAVLEAADDLLHLDRVLVLLLDEPARTLDLAFEDADLSSNAFALTLQFRLHVVEALADFTSMEVAGLNSSDDSI